jgi:hypothetical protein
MYRTLAAKMFASLSSERREQLGARIALRELVRREPSRDAWWHLSNGFLYGARINYDTHKALTRCARAGDRALRVLGRFHDLSEAARCGALHIA